MILILLKELITEQKKQFAFRQEIILQQAWQILDQTPVFA